MLFVIGISESFKGAWGVMGDSSGELLFGVAKDRLQLTTWVISYPVLVLASLTEQELKFLLILFISFLFIKSIFILPCRSFLVVSLKSMVFIISLWILSIYRVSFFIQIVYDSQYILIKWNCFRLYKWCCHWY